MLFNGNKEILNILSRTIGCMKNIFDQEIENSKLSFITVFKELLGLGS